MGYECSGEDLITFSFAVQLLTPAKIMARINGRMGCDLTEEDIMEVDELFYDAKKSAKFLVAEDNKYIH